MQSRILVLIIVQSEFQLLWLVSAGLHKFKILRIRIDQSSLAKYVTSQSLGKLLI